MLAAAKSEVIDSQVNRSLNWSFSSNSTFARSGGALVDRVVRAPRQRPEEAEMTPEPSSIRDALDWLKQRFCSDAARELCITYQFELEGDSGGVFGLMVDSGRLELTQAAVAQPDVILRISASDLFGVLSGRENPDLLFMAERLRVDGDLSLALKLRKLFAAT
jgi:putative sterol carrier protein